MPVAPKRRTRTGLRRRGAKRNKTRHHRHMHLSHAQVGFMALLQTRCFFYGATSLVNIMFLPHLIILYNYARDNIEDEAMGTAVMSLLHINMAMFTNSVNNFNTCEQLDHLLHDIPPDELEQIRIPPRQNIRFSSWSDQQCYDKTNFTKDQLIRIYHCFNLEYIAGLNENYGYIRVPTGHTNQYGAQCFYLFNPEELFLYTMMRMKTGDDHTEVVQKNGRTHGDG